MIKCPYCKSVVSDDCEGKECPICHEIVKSDDWIQKLADSRLRILKREGPYEQLLEAIDNERTNDAIAIIRAAIGREDTAVEAAMIKRIVTGPEILRKPLPASEKRIKSQANEQAERVALTSCRACNAQISSHAESCPHCGHPTGVKVCPRCGSVKTKVISGASKATSIFLWGPFAANKVVSKYQCKDCGHKF